MIFYETDGDPFGSLILGTCEILFVDALKMISFMNSTSLAEIRI
jgi:hypothetical protein